MSFLQASADLLGYDITVRTLDTLALARRLLIDEVDDNRLATLAAYFHTDATPCHRAWQDAAATAELLHALLERLGTMGILTLGDLLTFATAKPRRRRRTPRGGPRVHFAL
jgi:DNA polymerase-3 subunit epsilon